LGTEYWTGIDSARVDAKTLERLSKEFKKTTARWVCFFAKSDRRREKILKKKKKTSRKRPRTRRKLNYQSLEVIKRRPWSNGREGQEKEKGHGFGDTRPPPRGEGRLEPGER